ncbi:MAG: hypothetical protein U1E38_07035 [Rhodospirillales bacterium]
MKSPRKRKSKKLLEPTGIAEIDRLAGLSPCTIQDYVTGVSAYVRRQATLGAGPKKAGQIRLSNALARALADELAGSIPTLKGRLKTEEQKVAGGLRVTNADVSESHQLDGLRLAVELKPINLAVGRAIWNRFGDIRTFAVNIHLKFPFAVVGGVLVIPIYEQTGTKEAKEAEQEEEAAAEGDTVGELGERAVPEVSTVTAMSSGRKSTLHLIERAIDRLIRAGGRKSEAEAAHLLEGIAVIVYDPDTAAIHPDLPKPGSGLRWDEFVTALVISYRARFED